MLQYDIVYLFAGDARYDARMSNCAKMFGTRAAIVMNTVEECPEELHGARLINLGIKKGKSGKLFFLRIMLAFSRRAKHLRAKVYSAEDIYTLSAASHAARRNNAKLVYHSREIFSELSTLEGRKAVQSYWSAVERRFISKASEIFVTGALDGEYLLKLYHGIVTPTVVRNVPPFRTAKKTNALQEKLGLSPDAKILLYQGMMMKGRGMYHSIDALKHISRDTIHLVFIGSGPESSSAREHAASQGVQSRVHFLELVPYDELLALTESADVGLSLIEPLTFSYELALPNKLFEYIMAGVPTIVSDLPAMKDIVERYGVGEVVDEKNVIMIAQAVDKIISSPGLYREACLKAAKELCWEREGEKYFQTVMRLVQ